MNTTLYPFETENTFAMALFQTGVPTYNGMRKRELYRQAIIARDKGVCQYCLNASGCNKRPTVDHIYPRSQFVERPKQHNPQHCETNLIVACDKCNTAKGSGCWRKFAQQIGLLYGESAHQIIARIEATLYNKRPILPIVQKGKVTGYKMGF